MINYVIISYTHRIVILSFHPGKDDYTYTVEKKGYCVYTN